MSRLSKISISSMARVDVHRDHDLDHGVLREGFKLLSDLVKREEADLRVLFLAPRDGGHGIREAAVRSPEAVLPDGIVEHHMKEFAGPVGCLGGDAVKPDAATDAFVDPAWGELFKGGDMDVPVGELVLDDDVASSLVAVPRDLFAAILDRIQRFGVPPPLV